MNKPKKYTITSSSDLGPPPPKGSWESGPPGPFYLGTYTEGPPYLVQQSGQTSESEEEQSLPDKKSIPSQEMALFKQLLRKLTEVQGMAMKNNELRIALPEFKLAMRMFRRYRKAKNPPEAMFAFESGMLSIEAGGEVAVVHAEGEWHVRAWISSYYLGVFHEVPPRENPVVLRCVEGQLHISTLNIGCRSESLSAPMIKRAENPDIIDLLALDRTVPRHEFHGTDLGKRIAQAKRTASGTITRSSKMLAKLGITEDDLWEMVESQVKERMAQDAMPPS